MSKKDAGHDAFDLLTEISALCRQHARPLPGDDEVVEEWVGICFRLGGTPLVAAMGEVVEILTPQPLSRVPGAKAWVRGLANIRGKLLPVLDLDGYLHGRPGLNTRRSRILVMDQGGVFAGLMVDEVIGLRRFLPEDRTDSLPTADPALTAFLEFGFRAGGENWGVFSMRQLAETPEFLQAAM